MILQALARHYDRLLDAGILQRPGWQGTKVSFALDLDREGRLSRLLSLRVPLTRGKKEVLVPQVLNVPEMVKRTVDFAANFLCDNAGYMLGIDGKGKPQRSLKCFAACQALHRQLLAGTDHPAARAILRFFDQWRPAQARTHPALAPYLEEVLAGANLIFFFEGEYAQDIPALRQAWDQYYAAQGEGEEMPCLVTGQKGRVAVLHPSIKGVRGAQSSGASLVSFNAPAYESYARDGGQGSNAPVSVRAAFAYGAALNHLLSDGDHRVRLGDTTVVFWAEDGEIAYADCFAAMLGAGDQVSSQDLGQVMEKLAAGLNAAWDHIPLRPANRFYVLGLAPNAARLSVRFFLHV